MPFSLSSNYALFQTTDTTVMYVITDKEAQGRHLDGPCGQSPTPLTSTLSVPQKKNTKMKKNTVITIYTVVQKKTYDTKHLIKSIFCNILP